MIKLVAQEDRHIRLDDDILLEKLKHNVSLIMHLFQWKFDVNDEEKVIIIQHNKDHTNF